MGVPVNSVEDEMSFVMGAKGELGYFSSRRGSESRALNLYQARMNQASPIEDNVLVMSVDASLEDEVAGELMLRDRQSGAIVQVIEKCVQSDQYKFIVSAGGDYVLERAAMTSGSGNGRDVPALQRRIAIPADAQPEIVDVAFADLFEPDFEGLASEGLTGLDLPPFTGVELVVETEVEVETVEDGGVEGDAMVAHDPVLDEEETSPRFGCQRHRRCQRRSNHMDVQHHGVVRIERQLVSHPDWLVQTFAQ